MVLFVAALCFSPQAIDLAKSRTIGTSGKIAPKRYIIRDNGVALKINADNITLDFAGADIRSGQTQQSEFEGTGLLLENRRNVTIKNAKISGYRNNIRLLNCQNVRLENCDVGRSRAIRIATPEGKPIDHFVNIRDVDVWRTYGAGIWIENSTKATVTKCKGTSAQNGLLLVNSHMSKVDNCDFSFNSGWGIGLARSTRNQILWNLADFVSRPWAGGWGGDAAGVAVVDGSNDNTFVGNSFTHGGDGFFLTDRVNGGYDPATKTFKFLGSSNNNLIAYNDGSWSPANAFEGTFSFGNVYLKNLANDSNYGFWLGFSSDSVVALNEIHRSASDGIAIEQGSNNAIELNDIQDTRGTAIHLWSGTADEHKTRPSINNRITGNRILKAANAYSLENSTVTSLFGNDIDQAKTPAADLSGTISSAKAPAMFSQTETLLKSRPADFAYYRDTGMPLGLEWVQADQFAPQDFRNDIVAYRKVNESEIEVQSVRNGAFSINHSSLVEILPLPGPKEGFRIRPKLGESGIGGFIDPAIIIQQGTKTQVVPAHLFATDWLVRWFNWNKDTLRIEDKTAWESLFKSKPVVERHQREIAGNYSFKSQAPGINTEYFAYEATTKIRLDAGTYEISALPDDGLQVFFDEKPVIDAWRTTPGDLSATVQATKGVHELRVRFMQTWGHTYLRFAFAKLK